ncbi:MAG: GDYXXLXY domain-containing protein [Bernardetiaceae bacterium]|jgi:uncharacterized membrane-anchored protein|nr:GDYXXLXY domain-containing protein [Bernardetiaceae bacterium]
MQFFATNRKTIVAWLIGLQALILTAMFIKAYYPLLVGQEVTLQVRPRDPRDFLRGDYSVLTYDFSNLDYGSLPHDLDTLRTYRFGDWLYLELRPDSTGCHQAAGLWRQAPPGKLCLRVTPGYHDLASRSVSLTAGIESYFTTSQNARWLDRASTWSMQDSLTVKVKVKVSSGGIARISQVVVQPLTRPLPNGLAPVTEQPD